MLDFLLIKHRETNRGVIEVYPDFRVGRSKDLMIRGNTFYAIWNFETGMWSTDEYDVQYLVDKLLREYAEKLKETAMKPVRIKTMSNYSSNSWSSFKLFISKLSDQSQQLDNKVVFSNTDITKNDYVSRTLDYPLEEGSTEAFDKLFGTLYNEEELTKLMWALGSIVDGASKYIQKFFVLFGSPGTGKSTALNLIQKLFDGYYTTFEAQSLTNSNNSFSTEIFRDNPLIGINHEGDLSSIKDNSLLNSLVAHDQIVMNVKYHKSYPIRLNTMLFIATNKPVTITDSKSGLIRRLVDIRPTGDKVTVDAYDELVSQMDFELGAIAYKCLKVYRELGKSYFDRYKPVDMMLRTNVFFNFVDEYYYDFLRENMVTLNRAWELYKDFCEAANIKYKMPRYTFRDELRNYWEDFHSYKRIDGDQYRSLYEGFRADLFGNVEEPELEEPEPIEVERDWLTLTKQVSLLDDVLKEQPAQYASKKEQPRNYWDDVTTTLKDIDTDRLHFVLPTSNHIVIDFDIKDLEGNKSLALNIEAARKFPVTYAEVSKGGSGLHLHYEYDGDPTTLSKIYEPGIEVLTPIGKFSIRRKLTICNNENIAHISSGLPIKGDRSMISEKVVKSERALRSLILRNLNKEIHPATKPSVDFIETILVEAQLNGLRYDVSDMKPQVLHFASNSTNNSEHCIKVALSLPYENGLDDDIEEEQEESQYIDDRLTFYDVEVYPNLLLVCWKYAGPDSTVQRMFNPKPEEIGFLFKHKLVGFNNRRYDNHILYARYLGFTLEQVYKLSSRIVSNDRSALFREAYRISFTDVYDYASKKQSLKKWQLELGIFHKEMDLPWDEPVSEDDWDRIAEYCENDVVSLESLHEHLIEDYHARQILAEISGLTENDSTLAHTARIVFGTDRKPQSKFNYPDLSELFPGYTYNRGISTYRGEEVGEGGYVYAEPGIYQNVVYMDIASMHPRSIEVMNLFGPYTKAYSAIKEARIAIKNGNLDKAKEMFGGKLRKYLEGDVKDKQLAYALKIIINIVYGMTAASFDNPFRDPRNIDNVVAKRGALFMVDLKHELQARGIKAVHFKTDSVKIADYKESDVEFVKEFGKKYGYDFGIEGVFEKMALLNNADLIGKWDTGKWEAVGARMSKPYVFKTLFSKEPITFTDMIEDRAVLGGAIYLDRTEDGCEELLFIGKVGAFCPVKDGEGGGILVRIKDDKQYSVTGTKGFKWLPADLVKDRGVAAIDETYFKQAVDDAYEKLASVGDPAMILDQ